MSDNSPPTLSQRVFSGTAIQVAARLFSAAVNFAIALLLQWQYEREEFGLFNYYLTAFFMAAGFISFGANTIAVREISRGLSDPGPLLGSVMRFECLTGVMGVLVLGGMALWREEPVARGMLIAFASLHLVGHALSAPGAFFQARLNFRTPALALALGMSFFLIGSLLFYWAGPPRIEVYLVLFGGGQLLQALTLYLRARTQIRIRFDQRWGEFWPFFRQMAPIGLSAVACSIYMFMDGLMLRDLMPTELEGRRAVGDYSAAYRLLSFAIMIPVLFCQAVFPVMSKHVDRRDGIFEGLYRRSFSYLLFLALPLAVSLQFLSPAAMSLWHEKSHAAISVLRLLSWAILLIFAAYPTITALTAIGRQTDFMVIALIAGGVNLGLNLFWIPRYGIDGAAAATVVTEGLVFGAATWRFHQIQSEVPWSTELWKPMLAAGLLGGVAYLIKDWSLGIVFPLMAIGLAVLARVLGYLPPSLIPAEAAPAPRGESTRAQR